MIQESVACNLCGANKNSALFTIHDKLTNFELPFRVVKCHNCALEFINPRPKSQDISAFYPRTFFAYQLEPNTTKKQSVRDSLIGYIANYSAKLRVSALLKMIKLTAHARVLDMGCGKGSFLSVLSKKIKCNVTGVDFDKESVEYCQNDLKLDVIQGDANTLETLKSNHDAVTMWHYLEHEFKPATTLLAVNKLLKQDGYLIIEVPNADSLENKILGKESFLYDVPRHLYHFSPRTITKLLNQAGFEVVNVRYPFFSGDWIGSFQNIFARGKVFKDLRSNIFLFLFLSMLAFPIDFITALIGKGSIMRVLARKVNASS